MVAAVTACWAVVVDPGLLEVEGLEVELVELVELVAAVEQPAREMARATAATEREVRKERMVDS